LGVSEKEVAFVSHKITSPTTKKLLDDFQKQYPNTKIYSYELFNNNLRDSAWKKCYGTDTYPVIKWNEAKVILALEADFLGNDGNKIENTRLFAEGRDVENIKNFSRLYSAEANMSLTGINSDYRFKIKPELQYDFCNESLK